MTFSRITDTDPALHATTIVVGSVLLVLAVTDMLVHGYRLRHNLPLLTGWIVVGKLLQMAGILWMFGYTTWVLFMVL
jgi:hypothetical protein